MDAAEESFKSQIAETSDRATRSEAQVAELQRTCARLQMDTEKLDGDLAQSQGRERELARLLKEAEDRVR